ncbi:MAG: acyltransferase [Massilia sp.]|uniref:acyltransferase family protein n=1 Tax=Massilia sp. TaxID=1882437 RepID=UPI002FC9F840
MTRSLSLYLDLLRFLAAFAVYIFHAKHFAKTGIPFIGNFGSEAVIVFFVLSGLLIATATRSQPKAGAFIQARLSRLWSVVIPALVLTLVADIAGQYLSMISYDPMQPYSSFKWVASIGMNALFLNQVWYLSVWPGTNGPFWSLSYEFWYYMIFAAFVYLKGRTRIVTLAIAMLIAGPLILVAFPVWLLGTVVYLALGRNPVKQFQKGWVLWLGSFAAAFAFSYFDLRNVLTGVFPEAAAEAKWAVNFWPASYLIGVVIAMNIYGFALMGNSLNVPLEKISKLIRLGANISFGLYLFHYPLMYFAKAVLMVSGVEGGIAFISVIYIAPFVLSALLALKCEKHKAVFSYVIDIAIMFVSTRRQTWLRKKGVSIDDSRSNNRSDEEDDVVKAHNPSI